MTDERTSLRPTHEDDAAEVRRRALRDAPEPERTSRALSALGDLDWRVRQEAVERLRGHAADEALLDTLLAAVVQTDNVGRRNAALEVLASLGAPAVERLRRALREDRSGARKFYAEALGAAGDPTSAPDLAELTDDDDSNVGAAALEALVELGGPHAERVLRARLGSADPFARVAALDGLVRLHARLTWEELAPHVGDRVLRRAALPLLGRSHDARATPVLAEALAEGGRSASVAIAALAELGEALGPAAVGTLGGDVAPALTVALRDGDRDTRRHAASLAFALRDESLLADALDAAADDVLTDLGASALRLWGARAVAPILRASRSCVGLGRSLALGLAAELTDAADPTLSATLSAALREAVHASTPSLQAAALRGLAKLATEDDVPVLVDTLVRTSDELSELASEALRALHLRAPTAVDAALSDGLLRTPAAIRLFAHVRRERALEALRAALSEPHAELRVAAAESLGTLADTRARDDLAFALADEDERVRLAAVESLSRLRDDAVGDVLLQGLPAATVGVRAAVVRALGRMQHRAAIPALRDELDGPAPVAAATIEALGALGSETLDADARRAFAHADPEVAHAAVSVVIALGADAARPLLIDALAHEAWHVRRAAVRGLESDPDPGAEAALRTAAAREEDLMVRDALDHALEMRSRGAR